MQVHPPKISSWSSILFLFFVNDLFRNSLRSIVNIYADNTTAYRDIFKNIDDPIFPQIEQLNKVITDLSLTIAQKPS